MVAIVDYDAGNITSVERALTFLGLRYSVRADPESVLAADRVVFPGVGAADYAMEVLRRRGLDEALQEFARRGRPLLGICLGAQILLESSEESYSVEHTRLLGLIPGRVLRFPENLIESPREALNEGLNNEGSRRLKVPHIGWNTVRFAGDMAGLFRGVSRESSFYFVHSYYLAVTGSAAWGVSVYGIDFTSIVGKENVVGMQFHPEKSGPVGLRILDNFSRWE